MSWVRVITAVVCAVAWVTPTLAFAPASAVKPEDGYLSPTRYLSRYFGLSLVFPKDLDPVPLPVSDVQGSTRWLLGLQTSAGHESNLLITAGPPTGKNVAAALRSDFTDLPDKPKPVTIDGQSFWKATSPRQPDPQQPQTIEYAGIVRDYLLKIRIETSAGAVPDALTAAIESASFLAPDVVSTARTSDMLEYAGPALPELGKPTDAIARLDAGANDGRHYRNDALGLNFVVPEGLKMRDIRLLQTASAAGHESAKENDRAAWLQYQVAQTCTRSLLFAEAGTRAQDGHVSPTVMMTAMDRLCLGGVRFPTSVSDSASVKLVARMLAERVRTAHAGSEMKGRVYSLQGHVMLNLNGVLYGTEPGTGLRIPNHLRMVATEAGDYWVIWTFLAPDASGLDRLSNTKVVFYPARTPKEPAAGDGL